MIFFRSLRIDWVLFLSTFPLLMAGLFTMNAFSGESLFFEKQAIWAVLSLFLFFLLSFFNFRFLRSTWAIMAVYLAGCVLLLLIFAIGSISHGAKSWFSLGGVAAFQPSDPMKLIVILLLSKYFSRRHMEIANIRHIVVSGVYAFVPFLLIAIQPDFGSAMVIFFIWLGMVLVSGISKKHLLLVFSLGAVAFAFLWGFVFQEYQHERILTFLHPTRDRQGAGYNIDQSMVAIGSGELFGKGLGQGTQSRLSFLPEYQTDFIFAAFAEEWGFVGVLFVFLFFGILVWRILANTLVGETNFEMLYGAGLAIYIMTHFTINVGMNIGLLPVTGITLPFLSYGGSHLLTEFAGLGILMGMRRYSRAAHRDDTKNEFWQVLSG